MPPNETLLGRIDIDGSGAKRTMRDLRREGATTQGGFERLGEQIDKVGDRTDQRRIRDLQNTVRDLGRTGRTSSVEYRRGWRDATRQVQRDTAAQATAIRGLQEKVKALGRERATPRIEVVGLAVALAQLATLEQRLDSLSRKKARAEVTGVGVGAQAAGAASFAGSRAVGRTRWSATNTQNIARAMGSAAPPTQRGQRANYSGGGGGSVVRRAAAGGGGGGASGRRLSLGPLGLPLRTSMLFGALPAVNSVVGGATAVLGSAVQGATGLGALGIAGGGALGVGIGGTAMAAKGLATSIKGVTEAQKAQQKAQQQLNQAIQQYGASSEQAAAAQVTATKAQQALTKAYREAPEGTRLLIQRVKLLKDEFKDLTRPGQSALAGGASRAVLAGRRGLRRFGAAAINRVSRATALEGERLANFATGRTGERFAQSGAAMYAENLGEARETLEHIAEAWTNVQIASRPYLREAMEWLSKWTKGWATGTRDIEATRRKIGEMIDHLRAWKNLTGATFKLMRDLLQLGAPSGKSAVVSLTEQLKTWDEWVKRNPEKVREFFRDSVNSAIKLAAAIYDIVKALAKLGEQLRPTLDRLSELVTIADKLGLLNAGGAALAYGAYQGARGRGGVGGTAAAAAAGAAAGGRGAAGARAAAAAGAGGSLLVRTRGRVAAIARGAGRRFAPIGIGLGALDALSYEGSTSDRIAKGLSTASFGIVPGPVSPTEQRKRGAEHAASVINDKMWVTPATSIQGAQRRIRDLQAQIDIRRNVAEGGQPGGLERRGRAFFGIGGQTLANKVFGDKRGDAQRAAEEIRQFQHAINQARGAVRGFQRQLDERSKQRAVQTAAEYQERYTNLSKRMSPESAFANTLGAVQGRLSQRGPKEAGKREVARMTLDWAREVAKGRPKMIKEVRELERAVIKHFKGMAGQTATINGQIMVGTKGEWAKIAEAMSSAARRGVSATSEEFRRLRSVALGALKDMGFSSTEAKGILAGRSKGGTDARAADYAIKQGPDSYQAGVVGGTLAGPPSAPKRARGGRLPGYGLADTVAMSDGGFGAPGELVVNRHTESDHDRDARAAGLPTLSERVRRERRKHSDPRQHKKRRSAALQRYLAGRERNARGHALGGRLYAAGGRMGTGNSLPQDAMVPIGGDYGGGQLANPRIVGQLRTILSRWHARVTAGWAPVGTHAANSDHHWGGAVDLVPGPGGSWDMIDQLAAWAEPSQGSPAHGFRWVGYTGDPGHGRGNHLHLSWPMAGAVTGIGGGGGGNAGAVDGAGIMLRARQSGLGGVPGALSDRATAAYARGMMTTVNNAIAGGGATGGAASGNGADLMRRISATRGWNFADWWALDAKETSHGANLANPTSSARLRGQFLDSNYGKYGPGSDPRQNPTMGQQIQSMARYIAERYGDPGKALAFHNAHNWYGRGGRVDYAGAFKDGGSFTTRTGRPAAFVAGEGGDRETVTIRRARRRSGNTGSGRGVNVSMSFGDVHVADGKDFEKHALRAAELVAERLLERLDTDEEEAIA